MHTLSERERVLDLIKNDIESEFGADAVSATVYGSSFSDDYCSTSDIDILLILRRADFESLKKLHMIVEKYDSAGFDVDINVHESSELPSIRKDMFWHNNRALYMQIELSLYGKQLIGENPFTGTEVKLDELRLEVVRVLSSLTYQARKTLINHEISESKKVTVMKWCIYAVMYALAFWEIYPKTKKDAMKIFDDTYGFEISPAVFLRNKIDRPGDIGMDDVRLAYDFLSKIENTIINEYRRIYESKI